MSFLVPTFADAVEDLSMPAVAAPVVLWNGGVARREATVLSNILRVLLFAGESENEETDICASCVLPIKKKSDNEADRCILAVQYIAMQIIQCC